MQKKAVKITLLYVKCCPPVLCLLNLDFDLVQSRGVLYPQECLAQCLPKEVILDFL